MASHISEALAALPLPSDRRVALRVTPAAERSLRQGHPWLYDQAIRRQSHQGKPGDLAVIFDRGRRFLAIGLYDPHSPLRVRVLQHRTPAPIDEGWFQARLDAAVQRRAPLKRSQTTGYRLVHGENDGLPGLIIDRYDTTLVLKLYTVAWVPHLRTLLAALAVVAPSERIVLRLGRIVQQDRKSLYQLRDGVILEGPSIKRPVLFQEHGLTFEVDPVHGHKTGFFLDQRENRVRVSQLSKGRAVLDTFAYTGAFSVYAARGGARDVVSLDISRSVLAAVKRNLAHNRHIPSVVATPHQTILGDTFQVLAQLRTRPRRFDLVILDPPAFAKTRSEVKTALAAYSQLTRLGLGVLNPGGILVASSCSSQVSAEVFFYAVHQAAVKAGRPLHELARTGHALDHPVGFKEGAYLKCLFAMTRM